MKQKTKLVGAFLDVYNDSKRLVGSVCNFLKVAVASLPKDLLIAMLILVISISERLVARGDLDQLFGR